MADPKPDRPRLVSVKTDGAAQSPAPAQKETPERTPRGPVFWLLAALAIVASIGFAMQTERARVLQSNNSALEGELVSTRAALAAYTDRFAVVRETVVGLQSQIDALNSLVSEDPVPAEASPADPAPAAGASSPQN